jgi:3-hydroxyacyl-CoA dehydrogenase
MTFRSAAVLGAGVMGAQIAAHLANAGVPTWLLDVTAEAARAGLKRARGLKPDPFFTADTWKLVTTASLDEGLPRLREVDWIVEAVVEQLDVKADLLARVDSVRAPDAIVSSNTSGIPIGRLAEGRSDRFRQHWLGTHFFNPPRYLHLLEVIPTPDTIPSVLESITSFADRRLGKGVVIAKDSPNFIGNHLALAGVVPLLRLVEDGEYTIEEIDAITGPAIGRPKSATFRTLDLAGIDILKHVAENLHTRLDAEDDRVRFILPAFVERMVREGRTGEKAGRGFYTRTRRDSGESEVLTLDLETFEYRPRRDVRLDALDAAAVHASPAARIKALFTGSDRVGRFLRRTLAPMLVYAARVSPQIAYSPDDVDRVMRWGFGWELGPFEIADAIGIDRVLEAAGQFDPTPARDVPAVWRSAIGAGRHRLRDGQVPPAAPDLQLLRSSRDRGRTVKANAGARVVDVDDGVFTVEFDSKMNTLGGDALAMLRFGLSEAERHGVALVIGTESPHFSAGADLMLVLLEAQEDNWDELDSMVRAFQQMTQALRYARVPVVAAPGGLALGGGCEIVLHAHRVQAAAETYLGLVEVAVGLIPAGGGTTEMVARAAARAKPGTPEYATTIQRFFETIGFAKTSTSAADACCLGYLRPNDGITVNRERLVFDAKTQALRLVAEGHRPPPRRVAIPVGGDDVSAMLKLGVHLAWKAGRLSDHDRLIGRTLARIMSGGALPHRAAVSEQHLLDLEREAFLSLLGEARTLERIRHMLQTGKPLRN